MRWIPTLALFTGLVLLANASAAYESGAVSNGGTIEGVVRAKGKSGADEKITVTKDVSYCGADVPAEKQLVAADGGLQNAVVMLEGIASGKALGTGDFIITNQKCRFVPHVMVAPKGAIMKVRNDDPVLHNSHFYLVEAGAKKNVINLALPKKGVEIGKKKILRKPGLLSVQCDAHDFMQAWIWVVEHPYAVVTSAGGGFVLEDVPAGSYKLSVWHETLGEKSADVTVEAGKTASIAVAF
jgi:hypothetical protein